MPIVGFPALVFLAYILGALPWAAFRGTRRIRQARDRQGRPAVSRESLLRGTLVSLGVLFVLAVLAARDIHYSLFAWRSLGIRDLVAAGSALAVQFGLAAVSHAIESEEARRRSLVYFMAPRVTREWLLWSAAVLLAGVAEETAYRGVGWFLLSNVLGYPILAAVVCSVAFAMAHVAQGWKNAVVIFGFAVVSHTLVGFTHTLLLAMAVHVIYDFSIAFHISREARRYDHEGTLNA